METAQQALILFVFITLSGFFSGVETAFVSLSNIRLQHLLEQKVKGIKLVKKLKDNYQRLIITILIGNNLVNIAASSIATSIAIDYFKSNAVGISVGLMTMIILIFGEIIPKSIAMAKNEWIAVHSAPVIRFFQYSLFPIIKFLEWFTRLSSKPFDNNESDPIITEAEIKSVVSLGEEVGEIEEDERIMIHNIFRFSDLTVYEIMTDRTKIFAIDASEKLKTAAQKVVSHGYSRIPVFEGTVDNMQGILYAKDVLQAILNTNDEKSVGEFVRPAMFIPETILIDDLLREFQKEKVHIALIVDEHGGVSGLVTIEDLIEEIVGDIYDETDKEPIMIRKVNKNKSIVKGVTEIEEINRVLNLGIDEKDDFETISGFILAQLRHIPEVGEEICLGKHVLRITKADNRRIIEVEIEKKQDEPTQAKDINTPQP